VTSPEEALANPATHPNTVASIRGQIERITLTRTAGGLDVPLHGDLAGILGGSLQKQKGSSMRATLWLSAQIGCGGPQPPLPNNHVMVPAVLTIYCQQQVFSCG
jgi:hypothetical protein